MDQDETRSKNKNKLQYFEEGKKRFKQEYEEGWISIGTYHEWMKELENEQGITRQPNPIHLRRKPRQVEKQIVEIPYVPLEKKEHKLDLDAVARMRPKGKYDPKQFPECIYQIKNKEAHERALRKFMTGKFITDDRSTRAIKKLNLLTRIFQERDSYEGYSHIQHHRDNEEK